MDPVRPEFVPRPDLSREDMEALQHDVAAVATFEDDLAFDPATVGLESSVEVGSDSEQTRIVDDRSIGPAASGSASLAAGALPIVVGVDQAFVDDVAVSAIVALRGSTVVERVHAVEPLSIPYVPGLLSFREGGPILAAFEALTVDPDLALFDGSGRIHYRQAGLATHLGVVLDLPSIGVAKSLLCGRPRASVERLAEGARVAIETDSRVEDAEGEVLGYAVQTRQFRSSRRVNPVYVSPGHRVGSETAAELALSLSADYKLPEPIRLADQFVGEVRDGIDGV